jgi:hypothetical protein
MLFPDRLPPAASIRSAVASNAALSLAISDRTARPVVVPDRRGEPRLSQMLVARWWW